MNPSSHRNAFSLLELLVVIALVAVLASLVLTGLSKSKAKAKEVLCLNNLRQVSIGINLYQQHNDLKFPIRISEKGSTGKPPDPKGNLDEWRFFDIALGGVDPANRSPQVPRANERPLLPYLGPSKVFNCP